ncbi:MAG: DNA/RNA-binding protein AlbA [Candidatus Bathyarchaeia archaeon]
MPERFSILVGKKPVRSYVVACLALFRGGAKEIGVRARGRAISKAVSVVEVLRHRFLSDAQIKNINVGTEQIQPVNRLTPLDVGRIEITLVR